LRGILFALLLSIGIVPTVLATSLAPLSLEQLTDAADLIVRGKVVSIWTGLNEADHVVTRTLVQITRVYKDPSGSYQQDDVLVVDALGGAFAGQVSDVHLAPRYSVDEETILFLNTIYHTKSGTPDAVFSTVGMMLGKYTVRQNSADGSLMPVRFTVPYSKPYDARFIPAPLKAERIELSDFEQQILDRVEKGWDGQPIPGANLQHLRAINHLQPGVK
jgi:hypothetical protein